MAAVERETAARAISQARYLAAATGPDWTEQLD